MTVLFAATKAPPVFFGIFMMAMGAWLALGAPLVLSSVVEKLPSFVRQTIVTFGAIGIAAGAAVSIWSLLS